MPATKDHPDRLFECHVLHRRDYSNTSLLIELFSADHGRFPAIAKGAKSPRSASAALLQPFRPLWVKLSGRGEVKTLGRVEQGGAGNALAGTALYCGLYLNELLMRLLGRGDAHPGLYALYLQALADLSGGTDPSPVLRRFELSLLREIGYAMVLDRDADSGRPLDPGRRYRYHPEHGPVPALPGDAGFSVAGRTLLDLAQGRVPNAAEAREARELMRRVLGHFLGDKPLKSRELFRHHKSRNQT